MGVKSPIFGTKPRTLMAIKGTCRCSHPAWSWSPEGLYKNLLPQNFMFNHQFPHQKLPETNWSNIACRHTPTLWHRRNPCAGKAANQLVWAANPRHTHPQIILLVTVCVPTNIPMSHPHDPTSNPHQKPPCLLLINYFKVPKKNGVSQWWYFHYPTVTPHGVPP